MADRPQPTAAQTQQPCRWCGHYHGPRCPSVAAIEYHPDGTVKRVEFVQSPLVAQPLGPAVAGVKVYKTYEDYCDV